MPEKIVVSVDGQTSRVELTSQELVQRQQEETAYAAEIARRQALTAEDVVDEDILQPLFDADAANTKLLRAVALVLLDGINLERQARGANAITPAQLRNQVKTKLAGL